MTDYIGMVTGIIGSITGIAGSIMGFIAYRRSNRNKALDLRIDLKKSLNEVYISHEKALVLIEESNQSRIAVSAATGRSKSGGMEQWKKDVEKDKKSIEKLVYQLPHPEEEYNSLTLEELESKIVELHKLQTKIKVYIEKYEKEISTDDETRRFLRDQAHARVQKNT